MNHHQIIHNSTRHRFELVVEGSMAVLCYEPHTEEKWILNHTYVPDQLKGKGIGSELLQFALAYCRENQIKVVPECSFVSAYFRRYPQWQDLL